MNIHELSDILIVATGTLAVLLTAVILELIRERREAKRIALRPPRSGRKA